MANWIMRAAILTLAALLVTPAAALSLNGVTAFARITTLNAATDGKIKTVTVKPGQSVAEGEVLLTLENIRQQARLDGAEAVVRALQPDVTIAELEYERAEELYGLDSLSQVDLQNAENKLIRAEGQLQAAQAERDAAADDVARAIVKAPFSGIVDVLHVSPSQYVNPEVESAPLVTLVQVGPMLAVGAIEVSQWNRRLVGRKARVRVKGKNYPGRVSYLALQAQKKSGGKGLFELHVEFDSQNPMPAGLPVTIEINGQ